MKLSFLSRLYFLILLLISNISFAAQDDQLVTAAQQGKPIVLGSISVLQIIPMPSSLRNFLNKITLEKPQIKNETSPQDFSSALTKYNKVQTITSSVTIEGINIEVKIRIMTPTDGSGNKISVLVGLPAAFKFSTIDGKLAVLNTLDFTQIALAYSQEKYRENEWRIDIDQGVNFLARIAMTGHIGGLLKRLGQNMNEVAISGIINSAITGSKFEVGLGNAAQLGTGAKVGHTSELKLVIAFIETAPGVPGLSIAVDTSLTINISGQSNPIVLNGEFKYTPPSLLSLAGWMEAGKPYGPPAFGINGLAIGDLGISAGMDFAETAATAGVVPISELGFSASLGFGRATLGLKADVNYSTNPDLLLIGTANNVYLEDLLTFAADIIEKSGKLIGKKADLVNAVKGKMPPIGFKLIKIYVVPKDTNFLNVVYKKGIEVDVVADIINTDVGIAIRVDDTGFQGMSYLKGFKIGPVSITAGPSAKPGTPLDQATIIIAFDAKQLLARIYIDGGISIDVMEGIKAGATVEFSTKGLAIDVIAKIFKDFEAELKIIGKGVVSPSGQAAAAEAAQKAAEEAAQKAAAEAEQAAESAATGIAKEEIAATAPTTNDLQQDSSYSIDAKLTINGLDKFGALIRQEAQKFMNNKKKVEAFKASSKANVQDLDKKKADLQKQIDDAQTKIKALQDDNIKKITAAQEKLAPLQKKRDELDAAIVKCKGVEPKHTKEIDEVSKGKALTDEEIKAEIAKVKAENPTFTGIDLDKIRALLYFGAIPDSIDRGVAVYTQDNKRLPIPYAITGPIQHEAKSLSSIKK